MKLLTFPYIRKNILLIKNTSEYHSCHWSSHRAFLAWCFRWKRENLNADRDALHSRFGSQERDRGGCEDEGWRRLIEGGPGGLPARARLER